MTLKEATNSCFKQYVTLKGRATRSEFWKFLLFILLVSIALVILNSVIVGPDITQSAVINDNGEIMPTGNLRYSYNGGIFGNIFLLTVLLPWLAVTARRMHDIGKSAWWAYYPWALLIVSVLGILVAAVGVSPVVDSFTGGPNVYVQIQRFFPEGLIILMVFASFLHVLFWLCKASQLDSNEFGPNPHEVPS